MTALGQQDEVRARALAHDLAGPAGGTGRLGRRARRRRSPRRARPRARGRRPPGRRSSASPRRHRVAHAHSTGSRVARSGTPAALLAQARELVAKPPLPHRHGRAGIGIRRELEVVHESTRAGQPEARGRPSRCSRHEAPPRRRGCPAPRRWRPPPGRNGRPPRTACRTISPRPTCTTMLRATSEIAVAIRVGSGRGKPSRSAIARPSARAVTRSASALMATRTSSSILCVPPSQAIEQRLRRVQV